MESFQEAKPLVLLPTQQVIAKRQAYLQAAVRSCLSSMPADPSLRLL